MFASIDKFVRSNAKKAAAGVKSGFNTAKSSEVGGFRGIMGIDGLQKGWSRAQRVAPRIYNQAAKKNWSGAQRNAIRGLKMAGVGAARYFTAADFAEKGIRGGAVGGWGRAGIAGARMGAAYVGIQAADFLNPFGFGSISD